MFFETSLDGDDAHYHLVDGSWYRVDDDYLKRLMGAIDPHFVAGDLAAYTDDDDGEGAYNLRVSGEVGAICLDKKSIGPDGETAVEPCDVLSIQNGKARLIHVKRSTLSASLSHLFNQGSNSFELLRLEESSREKLRDLIAASGAANADEVQSALDAFSVVVDYAIITHKNTAAKGENLPLFSRISLMRSLKALMSMGAEARVFFIKDESTAKQGQKKKRQTKAKAVA